MADDDDLGRVGRGEDGSLGQGLLHEQYGEAVSDAGRVYAVVEVGRGRVHRFISRHGTLVIFSLVYLIYLR